MKRTPLRPFYTIFKEHYTFFLLRFFFAKIHTKVLYWRRWWWWSCVCDKSICMCVSSFYMYQTRNKVEKIELCVGCWSISCYFLLSIRWYTHTIIFVIFLSWLILCKDDTFLMVYCMEMNIVNDTCLCVYVYVRMYTY